MQITKSMFIDAYNNGIVDIEINKTPSTDEDIGVVYTKIDGQECFLVTNKIFDSFFKKDIFVQMVATLSDIITDDTSTIKINHLKSRKLIYIASNEKYKWSRWCIKDSVIYNYLNSCLNDGPNIKIKHWSDITT